MRSPPFWYARRGAAALVLAPAGGLYALAGLLRQKRARPARAGVPVICVGNVTAGGVGKTPVTLDIVRRLSAMGETPHILTRGYGGRIKGPHRVDAAVDDASAAGDEALLLARAAPTFVGADRAASARQAEAAGATVLVMDDGFQNPGLAKDISLLVVDAALGLGNGLVIPAGPLRETWAEARKRADAIILMGDTDDAAIDIRHPDLSGFAGPVLNAALSADAAVAQTVQNQRIVAFAGIGRPHKFFDTLSAAGAAVSEAVPFPDHHRYSRRDMEKLTALAAHFDAALWTTEKDYVRVPADYQHRVRQLPVAVAWCDEGAVTDLLSAIGTVRGETA